MDIRDNGGLKEPANDRSKLLLMYVLAGLAAAVVLFSMIDTLVVGMRITARHAPQIDAMMEIKLETTHAHLWFEEIISGDKTEDMSEVWGHIDSADWYAKALLEGNESEEGKFLPLKDDHKDNIFDIFHRLDPKNSPDGEGLGLTIVSRILDRHDGRVWVESEPDKGSRFFVSLPKA